VSISYAAVELAKRIFGDLSGRTAMLVGAGEMAELAAAHLLSSGVTNILIANRTFERAQELARQFQGEPVAFDDLFTRLHEADIVVSSTGAPSLVIRSKDVKKILRKRRFHPMFFIDIAVPRDIDPDVNNLDSAYLYDIDDLEEVVQENKTQRQDEASKAKAIVAAETCAFGDWLTSLDLNPTIKTLVDMAEQTGFREMEKTLKRLGDDSPETRQALETLVRSVALKVLHEPISFLKRRTQEEGSAERFIDQVRRIFNLDDSKPSANAHANRKYGSPRHMHSPLEDSDDDD
jgi:glutamyl-tRNA reductase